jgi:hypothetical protein
VEDLQSVSKAELLSMLKFGADRIFSCSEGQPPTDAELAAIIDRSTNLGSSGELWASLEEPLEVSMPFCHLPFFNACG